VARYVLPANLGQEFLRSHPAVEGIGPAAVALRQWLRVHIASTEMLAMPSRSVDALWHEFISRTEDYEVFCVGAYERQLDHYPETSMSPAESLELNGPAMARTFSMACTDEDIRPDRPSRLPLLFAADSRIGLSEGIQWDLECRGHDCRVDVGSRCIWHELIPILPARTPKLWKLDRIGQRQQPPAAMSKGSGATIWDPGHSSDVGHSGGGFGCGGSH
jgi:hypothetical protein